MILVEPDTELDTTSDEFGDLLREEVVEIEAMAANGSCGFSSDAFKNSNTHLLQDYGLMLFSSLWRPECVYGVSCGIDARGRGPGLLTSR